MIWYRNISNTFLYLWSYRWCVVEELFGYVSTRIKTLLNLRNMFFCKSNWKIFEVLPRSSNKVLLYLHQHIVSSSDRCRAGLCRLNSNILFGENHFHIAISSPTQVLGRSFTFLYKNKNGNRRYAVLPGSRLNYIDRRRQPLLMLSGVIISIGSN